MTSMEVVAGAHDGAEEAVIEISLRDFRVVELTRRVANEAVALRKSRRVRLPDAVIWASARVESAVLVTRNTRDFPDRERGIRVPYHLRAR